MCVGITKKKHIKLKKKNIIFCLTINRTESCFYGNIKAHIIIKVNIYNDQIAYRYNMIDYINIVSNNIKCFQVSRF